MTAYCETCEGTGEVDDLDTCEVSAEGNDSDGPFTYDKLPCLACHGTGETQPPWPHVAIISVVVGLFFLWMIAEMFAAVQP